MKPRKQKDKDKDKDIRYCVRCSLLEKDIKRDGSSGCWPMGGYYANHSYITDRELEKEFK